MNYNSRGNASTAYRRADTRLQTPSGDVSVLPAFATLILAIVVNVIVLAQVGLPVIRPALGFWFVVILPSYLLFTTSAWRRCGPQERLGYSLCAVLLILMLAGLAINEILP